MQNKLIEYCEVDAQVTYELWEINTPNWFLRIWYHIWYGSLWMLK